MVLKSLMGRWNAEQFPGTKRLRIEVRNQPNGIHAQVPNAAQDIAVIKAGRIAGVWSLPEGRPPPVRTAASSELFMSASPTFVVLK